MLDISSISDSEKIPLVSKLLEIIKLQSNQIQPRTYA